MSISDLVPDCELNAQDQDKHRIILCLTVIGNILDKMNDGVTSHDGISSHSNQAIYCIW